MASSLFALQSLPIEAAEFLAANNIKISGEVMRFTDSTVTIRPDIGSMMILAPGDIKSIRYTTNDGALIEGKLKSWHEGVYVIETEAKLISVKDGTITSEVAATAPRDQRDGGATEKTAGIDGKDQGAGADPLAPGAIETEPQFINQDEAFESARVSEGGALEEVADDDIVQIKATAKAATEEAEALVFDISSSKPPEDDIILVYATIEDTAKAGLDFVEKRGVLVFPAGEVSTKLAVPLIDDDEVESDESMILFLSGAPDVATIPLREITATIIDNDG